MIYKCIKRIFAFLFLMNLPLILLGFCLALVKPMEGDPMFLSNFLGDAGKGMIHSCGLFGGFCMFMFFFTDTLEFVFQKSKAVKKQRN